MPAPRLPRIIQSYWSQPSLQQGYERYDGGWLQRRFFLMCWSLSALQLRSFYPELVLYTDSYGKELLIDQLQLPYTAVSTALDDLDYDGLDLWTAGKLHTYTLQQEPYLHVDGDVVLFAPFGESLEQAPLVAQHLEADLLYYQTSWPQAEAVLHWLPDSIRAWRGTNSSINAYNMGTMGGQDMDFLQRYAHTAQQVLDRNLEQVAQLPGGPLSVSAEQITYYCQAWQEDKPVSLLLETNHVHTMQQLMTVNKPFTYLHPVSAFKQNLAICHKIAHWLRMLYPGWYYRIEHLLTQQIA